MEIKYIREFNGDERNVTLLGYGHGAACINFLMLSPMARGMYLFMTFFLMKINLIFFNTSNAIFRSFLLHNIKQNKSDNKKHNQSSSHSSLFFYLVQNG